MIKWPRVSGMITVILWITPCTTIEEESEWCVFGNLCVCVCVFSYPDSASGTGSPGPAAQPAAVCSSECVCRRARPWRWSGPAAAERSSAWARPLWRPSSSGSRHTSHPACTTPGRKKMHIKRDEMSMQCVLCWQIWQMTLYLQKHGRNPKASVTKWQDTDVWCCQFIREHVTQIYQNCQT